MNTHKWLIASGSAILAVFVVLILAVGLSRAEESVGAASAAPLAQGSTAFTYQGKLTDDGSPANGEYDFRFGLYGAASGGTTLTATMYLGNVQVTDGLFTVQVDFGNNVFTGAARWLEIAVRPGDSTGSYTTLSPRHELTPAPYALALPGLWTQQTYTSPNIIGGHVSNTVASGVVGAVIAGGGEDSYSNTVRADHTVIGGGRGNTIGVDSYDSTIGGGWANEIGLGSRESTIGGGQHNVTGINCDYTTIAGGTGASVGDNSATTAIGGGASNEVGSDNESTTISGGTLNVIGDNSDRATIGGGGYNEIGNDCAYATIAGGAANETWDNSPYNTIGGGLYNLISDTVEYSTIGGGESNVIRENNERSTIGGGWVNEIGPNSSQSTIGGGQNNDIGANCDYTTIAGGTGASVGDNSATTAIGGGASNEVGSDNESTTIAGGTLNIIGDNSDRAAIGGGGYNEIGDDCAYATIAGGAANEIRDDSPYSTVGGGLYNFITGTAEYATIAGGGPFDPYDASTNNRVYDDYGTIGGGAHNRVGSEDGDSTNATYATIAGGVFNEAGDDYATVGGGGWNLATGYVATIPGGAGNEAAGSWSFAAGRYAHANNDGCFVWGDATNDDVACNNNNRTIFRSTGGFYIYTDNAVPPSGLYLAAGGSAWNTHSDRNVKENFQPVDTRQLLDRLAQMPITTWNYTSQDPAIRHVGPMAQDFNTLLPGLGGEGETYINSLDADGVALAAIQGLYAQNQELMEKNAELGARVDDLESRLAALEQGGVSRSSTFGLSTWLLLGGLVVAGVLAQRRRLGGSEWKPFEEKEPSERRNKQRSF